MKKMLELRKRLNAKRPTFLQTDHQKRKEVSKKWKRPKGLQNKIRRQFWGKPAVVKEGYRGPRAVRGYDPSGLIPINVYTLSELNKIDPKKQGVIIGKVGAKKKITLLKDCKQKGITVLTIKNVDEAIKTIEDMFNKRKEDKKKAAKEKKKPEPKVEKKEEKKEEAKDAKEQERKEMEKIITKRG